jgi:hypothetical protein
MTIMFAKRALWMMLTLALPMCAQYKSYSDWKPTNEDGVEYKWVVDDLSPSACTVQVRDLYLDGRSTIRVSIAFRDRGGVHIILLTSLRVDRGYRGASAASKLVEIKDYKKDEGWRDNRMLVGCTFVDRLSVERVVRR